MKTIEISDELHAKLVKLADEVKTQDNRRTANVFFQIQDIKRVPAYEGCGEGSYWYSDAEEIELEDDNEIKEYILGRLDQTEESYDKLEWWSIETMLIGLGFEQLEYTYEKVYKNAFLTAKACQNHIDSNSHHYSDDASVYGSCAWRNSEIEIVRELLKSI